MLFYVLYLKLPQLLIGHESKLNLVAIDILTLYALIDSSFWFSNRSIVYIKGSQVIISK